MTSLSVWLDDKRPMPDGFNIHVQSAYAAIALLATGRVTRIGLDHDLGDEDVVGSGYRVACWIEEAAHGSKIPRIEWSIQSDNGPGRAKMERALQNADRFWAVREARDAG